MSADPNALAILGQGSVARCPHGHLPCGKFCWLRRNRRGGETRVTPEPALSGHMDRHHFGPAQWNSDPWGAKAREELRA